jgi:hypothetical protein
MFIVDGVIAGIVMELDATLNGKRPPTTNGEPNTLGVEYVVCLYLWSYGS